MTTYANSIGFPRPDWVMCGVPNPDGGVQLLASQELNQAELEAQYPQNRGYGLFLDPSSVSRRFFLTAEMRSFIVIDAPDYPAAFKALFEQWTPHPAERVAIGEGQREIGA